MCMVIKLDIEQEKDENNREHDNKCQQLKRQRK